MIVIDRFFRWFINDIYLPKKCNSIYVNKTFEKNECCNCKIYCKYPKPGKPVYLKIK